MTTSSLPASHCELSKAKKTHCFTFSPSQRTLLLQTLSFVSYLLLSALVFSHLESWNYLDGVYWADVTLLTVGLGDFAPRTTAGRALFIPFSLIGILLLGLVVTSIRAQVLGRGDETLRARNFEARRKAALQGVDARRNTIALGPGSWGILAELEDFGIDPRLSPAQIRQEEFELMRKVQSVAEAQRKWVALGVSLGSAVTLWLVGAAIFMVLENKGRKRGRPAWTYFEAVYFTDVVLLTIGYGDLVPRTEGGKIFFIFWSLLAVPSLTALISNMGDGVVYCWNTGEQWLWGGGSIKLWSTKEFGTAVADGMAAWRSLCGCEKTKRPQRMSPLEYEKMMHDRFTERISRHLTQSVLEAERQPMSPDERIEKDTLFYLFVLANECSTLSNDMNFSSPKKYDWYEWEYYLRLMDDSKEPRNEKIESAPLVPPPTAPLDGNIDRRTSVAQREAAQRWRQIHPELQPEPEHLADWSWLSDRSPLVSSPTECEWILARLFAATSTHLEHLQRGVKVAPPIGVKDAMRAV